jgi:Outer membrane protein beta-barrel domain
MFKFRHMLLVTSLLFLPLFAQAQINDGFYIGGGLGLSTFKLDEVKDDGGDIEGELVDESGFSYGINAGYAISNGILFEMGYRSLYSDSHSPYEDFEIDTDLIATTLGMKLILPVENGWGLLLSFGYGYYDVQYTYIETGYENETFGESSGGLYYGAGINYSFKDNLWMTLAFERHSFDDGTWGGGKVEASVDDLSLKMYYFF